MLNEQRIIQSVTRAGRRAGWNFRVDAELYFHGKVRMLKNLIHKILRKDVIN